MKKGGEGMIICQNGTQGIKNYLGLAWYVLVSISVVSVVVLVEDC